MAALTLLQVFEDVCPECGLGKPTTVIGNTDQNIVQMLALAQTLGVMISEEFEWEEIESSYSLTTAATNSQGVLTTAIGADYKRLVPGTMWDSSAQREIPGSMRAEEYEAALRSGITGVYLQYYIAGRTLYLMPAPAAGITVTGRYISTGWCEDAVGTGQARWADDTDLLRIDSTLYKLALQVRWKSRKGLPYGEDKIDLGKYALNLQSKQRPSKILDFSGDGLPMRGDPSARYGGRNWEDLATNWEELG